MEETRFIADRMLGRLAVWLRILGYDTVLHTGPDRREMIWQSLKENRVIITRDTHLTRRQVPSYIFIKYDHLHEQIKQLLQEYPDKVVFNRKRLFSRCTLCNSIISIIDKESVRTRVPSYIFQTTDRFVICQKCDKIYWQGSHWENIIQELQGMDNPDDKIKKTVPSDLTGSLGH